MTKYEEKQKMKAIETFDKCIEEERRIIDTKMEHLKSTLEALSNTIGTGKRETAISICDSIAYHYAVIKGLQIAKSNL